MAHLQPGLLFNYIVTWVAHWVRDFKFSSGLKAFFHFYFYFLFSQLVFFGASKSKWIIFALYEFAMHARFVAVIANQFTQ